MEVNIRDSEKLVDIWLTNSEKNDPEVAKELEHLYEKYKKDKYLVVVYQSGNQDLYENTLALLSYNKRRCAELEVQREKHRRTHAVSR